MTNVIIPSKSAAQKTPTVDTLLAKYKSGLSQQQIADLYRVAKCTVSKHLSQHPEWESVRRYGRGKKFNKSSTKRPV